jgi:hypothetical protein
MFDVSGSVVEDEIHSEFYKGSDKAFAISL